MITTRSSMSSPSRSLLRRMMSKRAHKGGGIRSTPSAIHRNTNPSRTTTRSLRRMKMSEPVHQVLQIVYLARHGETAWTLSGQYTGLTDLPLTECGERNARRLEEQYEGRRTAEIRKERPDWELFRDGCPGGESPPQAAARADRVVSRVRAVPGDVLLFSSGHFIRVLATRWIGLEVTANARRFMLSTASLNAVGYENELSRPVIRLWNDTHHVGD
jgi:broad specificity phosphatase PhoE